MKPTNTRHFWVGIFCLALLAPGTPFAAPNQAKAASPVATPAFGERSWRLDRANMFSALLGRMDELGDDARLMVQIGTLAGIDVQPVVEGRANLELSAKSDARMPPPRPSDVAVLALKARFNEALIEVDHQMLRFSVGTATTGAVTAAIISAASILR